MSFCRATQSPSRSGSFVKRSHFSWSLPTLRLSRDTQSPTRSGRQTRSSQRVRSSVFSAMKLPTLIGSDESFPPVSVLPVRTSFLRRPSSFDSTSFTKCSLPPAAAVHCGSPTMNASSPSSSSSACDAPPSRSSLIVWSRSSCTCPIARRFARCTPLTASKKLASSLYHSASSLRTANTSCLSLATPCSSISYLRKRSLTGSVVCSAIWSIKLRRLPMTCSMVRDAKFTESATDTMSAESWTWQERTSSPVSGAKRISRSCGYCEMKLMSAPRSTMPCCIWNTKPAPPLLAA
mmetsp:Transcript_46578/g.76990  ORF Transcript_46578/g.76990 Transcript_46578/m.76990 type:complete len:292 (-) Transcript_46578:1375-2250(-)